MEIFSSKLQEPYYTYIKNGIKIYELRVNDEKRKKMKIGDIWKFKNANNKNLPEYNTKIIDKKIYKSFEEAIKKISLDKIHLLHALCYLCYLTSFFLYRIILD